MSIAYIVRLSMGAGLLVLAMSQMGAGQPTGQPVFTTPPGYSFPAGSCGASPGYACGPFSVGHTCQCDAGCFARTPIDCCSDFSTLCVFCRIYQGCNATSPVPGQSCQCDSKCLADNRDDCCLDYEEVCNPAPPTAPVIVLPSLCDLIGCGNVTTNCSCQSNCLQPTAKPCCIDFTTKCPGLIPTTAATTIPATTAPLVQDCILRASQGLCNTIVPGFICQCNEGCLNSNSCCPSFHNSSCKPAPKPSQNCTALGLQKVCTFNPTASCQCVYGCLQRSGNEVCCADFNQSACNTPPATVPPTTKPPTLCANEGCDFNDPLAPCRCDRDCKAHNDCCSDYDKICSRPPPPRPWCADRRASHQCIFVSNATVQCQCDPSCKLFFGEKPLQSYMSHRLRNCPRCRFFKISE